ncbi:GntR family transcriptional regulator [Azospirillum sp. ST 5-10]|uniref:GntR family transcriptional regulator n=1 Tax=unclassified Azospirillum TaxID=2630922 RepID=UPI003F4A2F9C
MSGRDTTGATSRTHALYARLRDDIIYGALTPGMKLKIDTLTERYDVGATPLREALSLLTSDGLVERLDQRGFRVAQVGEANFEELLRTRCWLEERALRESIEHGGREWEEGIVLALYHLSRTPRVSPDVDHEATLAWERRHREFHANLIAGCRSSMLLRFCAQLYDENNRYRYIARLSPDARTDAYEEHNRIAEAALARDADLAAARLVEHYHRTGELLRPRLAMLARGPAGDRRGVRRAQATAGED